MTRRGRHARRSPVAVLAALALLGGVVGVAGGGTLALWRERTTVAAAVPLGVVVLGVGAPAATGALAQYATTEGEPLAYAFGPAQAAALVGTGPGGGAVAIPLQVDSLVRGSRSLTYTVEPDIEGGVFGDATWELYRVASVAACTTGTTGAAARTSTPWTGTYSTATTLRTEYWCLVARYVPVTGTHSGTATASGTPEMPDGSDPGPVAGASTWTAEIDAQPDPAAEPVHHLRVAWSTARAGGGT